MECNQSSTGPQSPTAPEDSETKNKKNSDIGPKENQVSVGGSSSTSNNSQARSYECIFCKRGFANAQALGGHMNIHRKDKEKLKHHYHVTSSIDQTARLMDMVIPRMIQHRPQAPPSTPQVVSWAGDWVIQDEGKIAEVKGRDDDNQTSSKSGEVRKLPLFIDQPLNKMDREEQRSAGDRQDAVPTSRDIEDVEKEKSSSEGHGSSEVSTVDLELRLGPEPLDPSSQPLSTRKFF